MEKVQHDPQEPWFLTGETIPVEVHSYAGGAAMLFRGSLNELVAEQFWGAMSLSVLNSSKVMSEKSLMPWTQECFPWLWALISLRV